jgi:hypothetical protein
MVDGIQVEKVTAASQSKSSIARIYNTVHTGYAWSPLTWNFELVSHRLLEALLQAGGECCHA